VARRYANLMATMLLGGLWHGASWTFVVWGGLHGTYLLINHAWRAAAAGLRPGAALAALGKFAGAALTFLAVVVAWVFFRATTFDGAARVLQGMFSFRTTPCSSGCFEQIFRGIVLPPTSFGYLGGFFLVGFALVWLTPTSQATTQRMRNLEGRTAWLLAGALLCGVALFAVINASHQRSEFIYFNF
jgi:alginate O-acetyltransferase complex protein AlgI